MCRAASTTEVFDFTANSVLGLEMMPELQRWGKKEESVHPPGKKYLYF